MNDKNVLELKNYSVSISTDYHELDIVSGIDITIEKGKCLCLVGESGCGKSLTSLSIMRLLGKNANVRADAAKLSNKYDILDMPISKFDSLRGNKISMIFQDPMTSLNPVLTIGEQLTEVLIKHNKISKEEAFNRAVDILEQVHIPSAKERMKTYPHKLSGGLRQRVMIAMALLNKPELLIADEPTTALDVTIQAQVLSLMQKLHVSTNTGILFITHDLGVVATIADEVAVMYAGKIMERGSANEIFSDPQHPYTIGLLASNPSFYNSTDKILSIPGQVPSPLNYPNGCRFSNRCLFADDTCRNDVPSKVELSSTHNVFCTKIPLESNV